MAVNYAAAWKNAVYCQQVYQNFSPSLRFDQIDDAPLLIAESSTDTQLAILTVGTDSTIVFRGSESSADWETNLGTDLGQTTFDENVIQEEIVAEDAQELVYPYEEKSSSGAKMHKGFIRAYFSVRDRIHDYIRNQELTRITITGHSLGGALATLCAVDIQYNFSDTISQIEAYTYGAPKVGNDGFRDSFNRRVPDSYRFVNGMDLVPALPRWWQGNYRHVDEEVRIGPRFSWNFVSARFKDHEIAEYIEELTDLAR
ncbi:MAG: lipase family protein [Thainema sp.]